MDEKGELFNSREKVKKCKRYIEKHKNRARTGRSIEKLWKVDQEVLF